MTSFYRKIGTFSKTNTADSHTPTVRDYGAEITRSDATNLDAALRMQTDVGFITIPDGTFAIGGDDFEFTAPLWAMPGAALNLTSGSVGTVSGTIMCAPDQYLFQGDGYWELESLEAIHAGWFGFLPSNSAAVNETRWNKFLTDNDFDDFSRWVHLLHNAEYDTNAPFFYPQNTVIDGGWDVGSTRITMAGTDVHGTTACYVDHDNREITWDDDGDVTLRGTPATFGLRNITFDCTNMTFTSGTRKCMAYMAGCSGTWIEHVRYQGPRGDNQMYGFAIVPERPAKSANITAANSGTDSLIISANNTGNDRKVKVYAEGLDGNSTILTLQRRTPAIVDWQDVATFTADSSSLYSYDVPGTIDYELRLWVKTGQFDTGSTSTVYTYVVKMNDDVKGNSGGHYHDLAVTNGIEGITVGRHDGVWTVNDPTSGGGGDLHGGKVYEQYFSGMPVRYASQQDVLCKAAIHVNFWDEDGGVTSKGTLGPYEIYFDEARIVFGQGVPDWTAEEDFASVKIAANTTAMTITHGATGTLSTAIQTRLNEGHTVAITLPNEDNPEKNIRIESISFDTDIAEDGNFSSSSAWTLNESSAWTITSGVARVASAPGAERMLGQEIQNQIAIGSRIGVTFTITSTTDGQVRPRILVTSSDTTATTSVEGTWRSSAGTYTDALTVPEPATYGDPPEVGALDVIYVGAQCDSSAQLDIDDFEISVAAIATINSNDTHTSARTSTQYNGQSIKMNSGACFWNETEGGPVTFTNAYMESGFYDNVLLGEHAIGGTYLANNKYPDNLTRLIRSEHADGIPGNNPVILEYLAASAASGHFPMYYVPENGVSVSGAETYFGSQTYGNET